VGVSTAFRPGCGSTRSNTKRCEKGSKKSMDVAGGAQSSPEDCDTYVAVGETVNFPPGLMKRLVIRNRAIVLANVDGIFYAFEDRCLHWGVRLSDGCLDGRVVRCRAHGWKHDVARGEVIASEPPGDEGQRVVTFETKVESGSVWVGAARHQGNRSTDSAASLKKISRNQNQA
jgi:nitrite reductase/ring-hydroxylating ferredoxin subunit